MNSKKSKLRRAVFIVTYRINPKNSQIEYLILKRHKHWTGWEFPKGGIDAGETPIQTAKREVREESGTSAIKIKKYPTKGAYLYPKFLKDRPNYRGQTYTLFSAQVKNGEVKIDKREHSDFAWLSFEKALKKLSWPDQKKCLRIVNNKIKHD